MNPDLLALPWKIQMALGAGYAGYTLGYIGLRKFHTASDVFFKTILFSLFASGVFILKFNLLWPMEVLLAASVSIIAGIIWNVTIRHLYTKVLKKIGILSNDLPTAWLSVSHDQENYFTQIGVQLEDGTWARCDNLSKFKDAPMGAAIFGSEGDIAFYVTHTESSNGETKALKSTSNEHYGDRMTYIPSHKISRINFRKKPIV
jgi:hypothetical protein